jgi:hypothetical protein
MPLDPLGVAGLREPTVSRIDAGERPTSWFDGSYPDAARVRYPKAQCKGLEADLSLRGP